MANNETDVDAVTKVMGGVALAERETSPLRPDWLSAVRDARDLPARIVRGQLQRLPATTTVVNPAAAVEFAALRHIVIGRGPIADMAVDATDGRLYLANHADHSVSVVDPKSLAVVETVSDIEEPFAITATAGRAFVSTVTVSYDAVTVVEPAVASSAILPVARTVRDIAVDRDGSRVYLARIGRDGVDVGVLTTADGRVQPISLGTSPDASAEAIAVSPVGARAYVAVAEGDGGALVAIDLEEQRKVGSLPMTSAPRDVVLSADGRTLYVVSFDPARGSVLDVVDATTLQVVSSVVLSGIVISLALGSSGRLYAVGDTVAVVSTTTLDVVDTITSVTDPAVVAERADGTRLYIADYHGAITVLSIGAVEPAVVALPEQALDAPVPALT